MKRYVDFRVIKERVRITQIIERYDLLAKLQCNGDALRGECPFCGNPNSFYVHPEKDAFNCFSCKKKGNILDFVAERERTRLPQAAHLIAEWFLDELPEWKPDSKEPS